MEFRILGPIEVWDGSRALPLGGSRQRTLLAILLLNANHVVPASRLIELLWQGEAPETATNAVQVYINHLRRLLEPERVPGEPFRVLVHRPQGYELRVRREQLDALRFQDLLNSATGAQGEGHWQEAADRLSAALALWRGPALGEFASASFALAEVARLEELRLRALEDRIEAELNLGRHKELVAELRGLAADHPLRERLCAQLMLALYRAGLQAEASDVYHRTRARLLDELAMEPGPLLERLFRDILRQAGHLQLRSVGQAPNNLPQSMTRFIGRDADLADLRRRLEAVRLLTLTGPGGIGKTRLAIELAAQVLGEYPDGIWLIDLAPISDPELIPQRLATELRLHEQPGRPLIETLAAHLRDRRALIVLDNCERLLDASADFASALLSQCSALTVVATSRQRLRLVGEQVWPVTPLSVPEAVSDADELVRFDAVRLFVDRAALVQPAFRLHDSNATALVQICRRLDGIPLALELAAAQTASFSVFEIAAKLDDRFGLLVADERDRPARHQTLAAAIEWSHHLLERREQVVFRRLGVFSGGFDLEAIHAVCATGDGESDATGTIKRLVEKSLVIADASVPERFHMLETMRDFANHRARAANEDQWLGRKHAEQFLGFVRHHGANVRSRTAAGHLVELDRNIDNVRAALEWASQNDGRILEQLALGLHSYWTSRCSFREALHWVRLALADELSPMRPPLLASGGWLALSCGQVDLGLQLSEEALRATRASRDERGQARALINLCQAYGAVGDWTSAKECLDEAVAITERDQPSTTGSFQDQALLAAGLCQLAWYHVRQGEQAAARASVLSGRDLAVKAGDYFLEALGSGWQSEIELQDGNRARAAELARHALETALSIDHRFLIVRSIGQLAAVAADGGRTEVALKLAAAVDSVRSEVGASGFDEYEFWLGCGWSSRLQQVRDRLGEDQAARISEEGRRLSLHEAAAIALAEQDADADPDVARQRLLSVR